VCCFCKEIRQNAGVEHLLSVRRVSLYDQAVQHGKSKCKTRYLASRCCNSNCRRSSNSCARCAMNLSISTIISFVRYMRMRTSWAQQSMHVDFDKNNWSRILCSLLVCACSIAHLSAPGEITSRADSDTRACTRSSSAGIDIPTALISFFVSCVLVVFVFDV
jgi:hypothetical protein